MTHGRFILRQVRTSPFEVLKTRPDSNEEDFADFGQHAIEFQLGQEFLVSHHEDRTHHRHLCHSPSVSILSCTIVSEARGWNSTSKMTFSPAGFVEDIKNVKSNLSTFKIFARITEEGVSVRPPSNLPDLSDDYDDIEDILEDFD